MTIHIIPRKEIKDFRYWYFIYMSYVQFFEQKTRVVFKCTIHVYSVRNKIVLRILFLSTVRALVL
jgi:hypothetical protein